MSLWALLLVVYFVVALLLFPVYIWDGLTEREADGYTIRRILWESVWIPVCWLPVMLYVVVSYIRGT